LSVSHAPEETNEQPAEMTPESVLESLGHLEYKMNLSFSTFHHQNLVSKDEKKQLMKTTQKAIEMAEKLDNDPELAQQITSHAYKILAIDAGREYVLTPKKKTLGKLRVLICDVTLIFFISELLGIFQVGWMGICKGRTMARTTGG